MPAPKLNIHCKSLFIVHQGDKVFNYPRDVKIHASKFFKCLLISKQFLRASQMYRVYQFAIFEFCGNNKFNVTFANGKIVGAWAEHFQLTLEELRQLNQLLDVQYMDVFRYNYNHAHEYSEACKIFKRHIALNLTNDESENEVHHHEIIKQVKDQLYSLRCGIKSLLSSSELPHLNLPYCALKKVENFYNLKQVLVKHRIESLAVGDAYNDPGPFYETIDDDYFDDFPVCSRIKKVDFTWTQLDEHYKLLPKLVKIISFFPNLTEMGCYFNSEHHTSEQFNSQKLTDRVKKECRTIDQLRKACPLNTSIKLTYIFRIRRAEPLIAIKQTTKYFLKTTKFNQLYYFKSSAEEVTNDGVVSMRYHYCVIIHWKEQNFKAILLFEGDLDPLTVGNNEVIEEDDNLLVPLDE